MLSLQMTQSMQERVVVIKGELRETAEREETPRRETRRQAFVDTRNRRLANVDLPYRAARSPEPYPATERALEIHSRMNERWTLGRHDLAQAIYRANNASKSYVRSTNIKRMAMNGLEDEIRAAAARAGAPWALTKEAELRASRQAHHANAQGTEADETQDALAAGIGGLGEVGPADLEAVEALLSIRENPLQTSRTIESVVRIETADIEAASILMGLRGDSHQKM